MKYSFFLLSLLLVFSAASRQQSCERITECVGNFTCPQGEFLDHAGSEKGCCPECVGGGLLNDMCNANDRCAPGLKCSGASCVLDTTICASTQHAPAEIAWKPSCDAAGNFLPKQCRGDRFSGRCFCYSSAGKRIFGWQWRSQADNMTCACSRRRSDLEAQGRWDVTLHCTPDGSFEPLQCDGGSCWCAHPDTGKPLPEVPVVQQSMWKKLPCYNTDDGDEYLRQCESARYAQELMRSKFVIHGQSNVTFLHIYCDYDGSYGRFAVDRDYVYCTWRDGERMDPYRVVSAKLNLVNCYCARDQKIFADHAIGLELYCSADGSYERLQNRNGELFCVDSSGFVVGIGVSNEEECSKYLWME